MATRTEPISRRTVLRGAGAMLALPFLETLAPTRALASTPAGQPPLRMGIFTVTGGTVHESWAPKEGGALDKLPSILRPLEPFKEDLLVVSGLSHGGRSDGVNAHESCAFKHLTGADFVKREGGKVYAGISVDQAAARVVGEETFLPSIEMGLTNQETRYSFRSAEQPLPYEANPRLVFDRMFRGRKPVVPNWQRRAAQAMEVPRGKRDALDQSVVDAILEQARELKSRVSRSDQRRLDEYLESVRSVEKRIAFVEARRKLELLEEANPGPSKLNVPGNLPESVDGFWKQWNKLYQDPEVHGQYIAIMADLMVLAFQTDTTRVVTLAAGDDGAMFPGVITVGYERHCHTLEHLGNAGRVEDADPIAREALRQIHVWYTSLFAEMIRKMKAIDEGGSSLLDNSMILYTSYMADGGHGQSRYPALLAGKARGTLRTGRHVAFPEQAPMANLYVEMLDRMGARVESFGNSHSSSYAGKLNGRLPGLV